MRDACILISGGTVKGFSANPPPGGRIYNAGSRYVVPGLIDLHVHLRGLRLSYKEDEESGTKAALSAGITLVVDMPNTLPPLKSPEALDAKLSILDARSYTDYGVYAGLPEEKSTLRSLLSRPIAGLKIYPRDMDVLARLSPLIPRDLLVVLHPELPEADKVHADSDEQRAVLRHEYMEAAAVLLAADTLHSARLHVTHVTSPSTIRAARSIGATIDTTVNYIYSLQCRDCLCKVNPPRRRRPWDMLLRVIEGDIDCIASDHAPHTSREKSMDYLICPPGIAGIEHWPWLLYGLVAAGALSLDDYVALASRNPARILGIRDLYGVLAPGARANMLVIDTRERRRIIGNMFSKAKKTPYWMMEARGAPKAVFIGGCLAAEDGVVGERSFNPLNPFKPPAQRREGVVHGEPKG